MIRRLSLPRKPAAATRPPAKKPVARTLKAKLLPPVVTLKHLAAEIAEAHEVPKTRAETMLADTVVRLARHLVMASTRATEGKMSGNDKFLARIEEILALCGSISSILETKIDDDLHAELAEIDENLMSRGVVASSGDRRDYSSEGDLRGTAPWSEAACSWSHCVE